MSECLEFSHAFVWPDVPLRFHRPGDFLDLQVGRDRLPFK